MSWWRKACSNLCCLFDLQACRALVAGGADVMRRNNKNRVPGNQLKVSCALHH
jgi:polysaccharide pyruvyl transferase WcaK-like protein